MSSVEFLRLLTDSDYVDDNDELDITVNTSKPMELYNLCQFISATTIKQDTDRRGVVVDWLQSCANAIKKVYKFEIRDQRGLFTDCLVAPSVKDKTFNITISGGNTYLFSIFLYGLEYFERGNKWNFHIHSKSVRLTNEIIRHTNKILHAYHHTISIELYVKVIDYDLVFDLLVDHVNNPQILCKIYMDLFIYSDSSLKNLQAKKVWEACQGHIRNIEYVYYMNDSQLEELADVFSARTKCLVDNSIHKKTVINLEGKLNRLYTLKNFFNRINVSKLKILYNMHIEINYFVKTIDFTITDFEAICEEMNRSMNSKDNVIVNLAFSSTEKQNNATLLRAAKQYLDSKKNMFKLK